MERFFILDRYNTWYDWGLILTSKSVTPPTPKTNYVTLDGMSGTLDLSEALSGEITYEDRTVSATFWTDVGTRKDRERLIRDITSRLHGKKIRIIEPDDPDHYFIGRVNVTPSINNLAYAEFSLEAICEPWRYAINNSERRIEVDNLIRTKIVIHNNGVKTLCPTITVDGYASIVCDQIDTALTRGVYKISDIKLRQGVNIIEVSGLGSVTFTYKEADL